MTKPKITYHLMAVPRDFTAEVLAAGGRFLKMKNKQLQAKVLQLIQLKDAREPTVHILDPSQHRTYEMLGEEYIEDISICKTVFEQNRGEGYRIFKGSPKLTNCKQCIKILKQKNAAT